MKFKQIKTAGNYKMDGNNSNFYCGQIFAFLICYDRLEKNDNFICLFV